MSEYLLLVVVLSESAGYVNTAGHTWPAVDLIQAPMVRFSVVW